MLHIKRILTLPFPIDNPVLEKAIKNDAVIFDIETTGLNPHRNRVVLIGFIRFDRKNRLTMNQLFIDDFSEEAEMLSIFYRIAASSGFYVTYNGTSFDLPFLNTRMNQNSRIGHFDSFYNIDLMRVLKSKHFDFQLPDYKLKTVEKHMGISRSDLISGKESVELYEKYISSKDPGLKDKILLHNADDITNLYKLLKIFEFADQPEIFFDFSNEFIVCNKTFRFKDFRLLGDFIVCKGICLEKQDYGYAFNDSLFSFELDEKNGSFSLRIPVSKNAIGGKNYSIVDANSIPFASENIKSFISGNPQRMVLSTEETVDKNNLLGIAGIIMENIFAP